MRCYICRQEKDKKDLVLLRRDISEHEGYTLSGMAFQDVWHCSDCKEKAQEIDPAELPRDRRCYVCKKVKNEVDLDIFQKDVSLDKGFATPGMTLQNVRFCRDDSECRKRAEDLDYDELQVERALEGIGQPDKVLDDGRILGNIHLKDDTPFSRSGRDLYKSILDRK